MRRAESLVVACALLAGCSAFGPGLPDKPMFRDPQVAAPAAAAAVVPGRTTKAELASALGDAETLRFDSGYEVWVYRVRPARTTQPELVVLFGPDGIARKVRMRPGDAAR